MESSNTTLFMFVDNTLTWKNGPVPFQEGSTLKILHDPIQRLLACNELRTSQHKT